VRACGLRKRAFYCYSYKLGGGFIKSRRGLFTVMSRGFSAVEVTGLIEGLTLFKAGKEF
jgi:hypothetical protein